MGVVVKMMKLEKMKNTTNLDHFVWKQLFPVTFCHFYRTSRLGIRLVTFPAGYFCGIITFRGLFGGVVVKMIKLEKMKNKKKLDHFV